MRTVPMMPPHRQNLYCGKYLHSRKNSKQLRTTAALYAGNIGKKKETPLIISGGKIMHSDKKLWMYLAELKRTTSDHGPAEEASQSRPCSQNRSWLKAKPMWNPNAAQSASKISSP